MTTALEIAQDAMLELGLSAPASVYGSGANADGRQLGALLNRIGKELTAEYDWSVLQKEHVIYVGEPIVTTGSVAAGSTTISAIPSTAGLSEAYSVVGAGLAQSTRIAAGIDGSSVRMNQPALVTGSSIELTFIKDTFDLPADFARYLGETWWDRSNQWQLIGPVSAAGDAFQRSGIETTGPRRRWREVGGAWRVWPPPTSNDSPAILVFDYLSSQWAANETTGGVDKMANDADTPLLPEHVLVLGLKAAFWRAKGFDWEGKQREFVAAAARAAAQDGGSAVITMGGRSPDLIEPNVPDGSWQVD